MDMEDALAKVQKVFEQLDKLLALPRLPASVDKNQLRGHRDNLKSLEENITRNARCSAAQMKFINSIQRSVEAGRTAVSAAKNPAKKARPS